MRIVYIRIWGRSIVLSFPALSPRLQPALGVNGRHTATPCSGNGLAIHVVGDVAGGKHAGHIRMGRTGCSDDVALGVQGELPAEERCIGNMTDSHEQAVGLDLTDLIGFGVAYLDSLHAATRTWLAEHVFDHRVPHEADLVMLEGAFLHDF